jgi:hypothetical protein
MRSAGVTAFGLGRASGAVGRAGAITTFSSLRSSSSVRRGTPLTSPMRPISASAHACARLVSSESVSRAPSTSVM